MLGQTLVLFNKPVVSMVFHRLRHFAILKTISIYVSFFSVLVHEWGHAFAAQILNGYVSDICMIMTARQ
jgi:hypothetical protein